MKMNSKENPGLPFQHPQPTRTREEIERSIFEKLHQGSSRLDFTPEEAEVYEEMLEKERQERD